MIHTCLVENVAVDRTDYTIQAEPTYTQTPVFMSAKMQAGGGYKKSRRIFMQQSKVYIHRNV